MIDVKNLIKDFTLNKKQRKEMGDKYKNTKLMNNLKLFLYSILLTLVLGCSSEQAIESKSAQEEVFDLNDSQESFKFERVPINPEDKAIADKAPEGMVFIKGGCFILGNNFAQVDEAPEHEVCVDDFYLDIYEVTQ